MIKDVTDLEVYNKSNRLLAQLYEFFKILPKSEMDTEWQIKQSAKSILHKNWRVTST